MLGGGWWCVKFGGKWGINRFKWQGYFLGLAAATKEAGSLANFALANGFAAGWTGFVAPSIDIELLCKIARSAITLLKIFERCAALLDRFCQHLFNRFGKALDAFF